MTVSKKSMLQRKSLQSINNLQKHRIIKSFQERGKVFKAKINNRQTLRQRFISVMDISAWPLPGITVNINAGQRSVMQRKT